MIVVEVQRVHTHGSNIIRRLRLHREQFFRRGPLHHGHDCFRFELLLTDAQFFHFIPRELVEVEFDLLQLIGVDHIFPQGSKTLRVLRIRIQMNEFVHDL